MVQTSVKLTNEVDISKRQDLSTRMYPMKNGEKFAVFLDKITYLQYTTHSRKRKSSAVELL
jgi:hypothetical protein